MSQNIYDEERRPAIVNEVGQATLDDLNFLEQTVRNAKARKAPNLQDPAVLAARHRDNDAEMKKMAGMNPAEHAEYQRKTYGF